MTFPFRRLVEEVKDRFNLELQNEDVFLATTFFEFGQTVVLKSRGGAASKEVVYDAVVMHVNNMDVKFPTQLFIDGEFVNAEGGRTIDSINPADESVICGVSLGGRGARRLGGLARRKPACTPACLPCGC